MKKVVICGGHLTPAISTIEKLEGNRDVRVYFLTRKHVTEGNPSISAEYLSAQKHDVTLVPVIGGKIQRRITRYSLFSLLKIPVSFVQILYKLFRIQPDLVVGFGGPLSFPAVFGAWLLGIPTVIHEQASRPGLSNQLSAYFCEKIFVSWAQTQQFFPGWKTEVVGNLVRKGGEEVHVRLRKFLNAGEILAVMGGNQGSHFLNKFVFENLENLSDYKILHVLGKANFKNDHERAKKIKSERYFAADYLSAGEMAKVYQKAKLILSRSGANTVWDIAFNGKVAVFVPLPASAGNEQLKNAQILERQGCVIVVEQKDASAERIFLELKKMEANYAAYSAKAKSLSKSLPADAADVFGQYLIASMNEVD